MWVKKKVEKGYIWRCSNRELLFYFVTSSPSDKKMEFTYSQKLLLYTPDS